MKTNTTTQFHPLVTDGELFIRTIESYSTNDRTQTRQKFILSQSLIIIARSNDLRTQDGLVPSWLRSSFVPKLGTVNYLVLKDNTFYPFTEKVLPEDFHEIGKQMLNKRKEIFLDRKTFTEVSIIQRQINN